MAENAETERQRTFKFVFFAQCACTVCLIAGMSLFHGKWIPGSDVMRTNRTFYADMEIPRGHFGFVLSRNGKLPSDVGTSVVEDCDGAGTKPFSPPCYPGLHSFVRFIWMFTLLFPILPVLVSMLTVLLFHRDSKQPLSKHLLGACESKSGKRHFRLLVYLAAVMFLQVFVIVKRKAERAAGMDWDPSDTIYCFFGCITIAMREMSHLGLSDGPGSTAVQVVVAVIVALTLYYIFWTAHYFHLPSEVFAGGIIGVVFSAAFVLLTTTESAMRHLFLRQSDGKEPLLG